MSYKAGVKLIDPRDTTRKCSKCSGDMKCSKCGPVIDRQLNAAKNLIKQM